VSTPSTKQNKKNKNAWRDSYIRLLNEDPKPDGLLSDEEARLQLRLVVELIESKYATGFIGRNAKGEADRFLWDGPTVEGRLLADRLTEERKNESWKHRIWLGLICLGGWIAGIASVLIAHWLTK
jgi:hypothetical protein